MPTSSVRVKKVNAYPMALQLKTAAGAVSGQIVKLTTQGFLAEVQSSTILPGEKFDCSFELPVLHHFINEPIVVVKIYSSWGGGTAPAPAAPPAEGAANPTGPGVVRLIEAHFQNLSNEDRARITAFCNALAKGST